MALVDLAAELPTATIDYRYATTNNVAGKVLYRDNPPRLEEAAVKSLKLVLEALDEKSLRLVIWDGYRTEEAQDALKTVNADTRYVRTDSNHPKGLAVDVTIAEKDGNLLDMGTVFDHFGKEAHSDFALLSGLQLANRNLLATVMEAHGFKQWPWEWWHFDFIGNQPQNADS